MGGAKKKIKKIIPKEIKPALPAIAAISLPYLATTGAFGAGKIATLATKYPGIAAALSNAATQAVTQDKIDLKSAALSGLQAGVGAKLQGADQFKMLKNAPKTASFLQKTGRILNPASEAGSFISQTGIPASSFSLDKALGTASAIGKGALPVAARDTAKYTIEMNEKALRDYEAKLAEQGVLAKDDRRNQIFGYFSRAGYGDDEINTMLSKYGYADGGRVTLANGGNPFVESRAMRGRGIPMTEAARIVFDKIEGAVPNEDDENYEDDGFKIYPKGTTSNEDLAEGVFEKSDSVQIEDNKPLSEKKLVKLLKEATGEDDESKTYKRLGRLNEGLEGIMSGYQLATGQPLMGARSQPMGINPGFGNMPRMKLAEGGIPSAMAMRKTIAELIQAGIIDEEDVEKAVEQIKMQAMNSMKAPGFADGGIMNLGGREMDMRGGGFIPIGAKEKADDVPARLSKNEFVMTADAVRGAGNGSINKGAKRMYDLMNKLESKV